MDRIGYRREARDMLGWIFGWYKDKYHYKVPDGFQIHHIDRDCTNNSLDNLAILTVEEHMRIHEKENKENGRYGKLGGKKTGAINGKKSAEKMSKPVLCVETGIIYKSTMEAGRQTGISRKNIGTVCRHKRKTAGGYHWEFVDNGG